MSQFSNHNDAATSPVRASRMDGLDADIDVVRSASDPIAAATYIVKNGDLFVVSAEDLFHQIDKYQAECMRTAVFDERWGIMYPAIGMAEESGEVVGKIKKWMRDDSPSGPDDMPGWKRIKEIAYEIGDNLWYASVLAGFLGIKMSDILRMNIEKIRSRHAKGTIHGSGDER